MSVLTHYYGCTELFGGWLAFLYGNGFLFEGDAHCHYGVTVAGVFIGVVVLRDADQFIWGD